LPDGEVLLVSSNDALVAGKLQPHSAAWLTA
jgi:hypothetical protein